MVLVLIIGDVHIPHRANVLPAKFKKLLVRSRFVVCARATHACCASQVPGKISHIISTGNLCCKVRRRVSTMIFFSRFFVQRKRGAQEVFDYLKTIANDVHVVKGEFDDATLNYPENKVVTVGAFRIGVTHGHQVVPWGDKVSRAPPPPPPCTPRLTAFSRRRWRCCSGSWMSTFWSRATHTNSRRLRLYACCGCGGRHGTTLTSRAQDRKFFINPGSATGAYGGLVDDAVPTFVLMDVQVRALRCLVSVH